jgi:hypothetical protein
MIDLRHLRNARTALAMFLSGRSPKELAPYERSYYAGLPERLREMQSEIERLLAAAQEPGALLSELLADEPIPISAGYPFRGWDAAIAAFERNKLRAEMRKALAAPPAAGSADRG